MILASRERVTILAAARVGAACAPLLLGACATPPSPEPSVEAAAPEPPPRLQSQPLKYLAGRHLKPLPTRPLNIRSKCSHRDALGTRTQLDLLVKNAEVKIFNVQVNIPRQGICRFDLKHFEQAAKLPQTLLKARDGSNCSVRMWEQGKEITIAFNSCPNACEGDAFSYLWPILVNARTGRCT